jgi:hypothetical protein
MKARSRQRWVWLGMAGVVLWLGFQSVANGESRTADMTGDAPGEVKFLTDAWRATGATVSGYEIHLWQPVARDTAGDAAMAAVIDTIRQEFRLDDEKCKKVQANGERLLEVTGKWQDGTQVTALLTSWDEGISGPRTVLVVRAENQTGSIRGFAADLAAIHSASNAVPTGSTSEISACLQGFLDDRIVGVAADRLVSAALRAVGATPVEGMSTATETSISGYSARESTYIITSGRRMNIQVAVHPDTYHQRTNLLIGTPIITSSY